jgi:hypothetical protein
VGRMSQNEGSSSYESNISLQKWIPATETERYAVRQQLARVLESGPFSTSKRCIALLTYVVERALESNYEAPKERTLGIEVFRRPSQYDTNADPVVRVAAGEVRKKLAQYYYDPNHKNEIHIELPPGTYLPEFYPAPEIVATGKPQTEEAAQNPDHTQGTIRSSKPLGILSVARGQNRWPAIISIFALLLAFFAGVVATRLHATVASAPPTGMEEFWRPLISAPGTVWMCVGESYVARIELDPNGARNRFAASYPLSSGEQHAYPALNMADSIVLANVAALLKTQDKNYSVHGESETTFSDLASSPAVLIGSFNNDWSIRLSDQLRFHFEMDRASGQQWIVDREKPDQKIGVHIFNLAVPDTSDAYAIISRVRDPSTRQMVVALSGVSADGTRAAGAFVSEPTYLADFAKRAPRNWQNANLQIVIAAPIVDGSLGPPRVVSTYLW